MDETFIGRDFGKKPKGVKKGRGFAHKNKVLSLVDRESGKACSMGVDDLKTSTLLPLLKANISADARVRTDEAGQYKQVGARFADHGYTRHGQGEYVSKIDRTLHTNTIEGIFSAFKRGMKGIYQHCGHNHLNRYVTEFNFRYNNRVANGINDAQRADILLLGVVGKRLS